MAPKFAGSILSNFVNFTLSLFYGLENTLRIPLKPLLGRRFVNDSCTAYCDNTHNVSVAYFPDGAWQFLSLYIVGVDKDVK